MKSLVSTLVAAAMVATSLVVAPIAVSAAPLAVPMPAPLLEGKASEVEEVQYRRHRGHYRGHRGHYRGHRGHRHRRPGYRYHNGYWFPPAAFLGAVIVGGAIAAQQSGNRHVRWCHNRYRSYREWDNTFKPHNGPRRQCRSPY